MEKSTKALTNDAPVEVELVEFVCMAMLSNVREILLAGDFGQNIRLLQVKK